MNTKIPVHELNNLHRKLLNKIHSKKGLTEPDVEKLSGSDFFTLCELIESHYVVLDPDSVSNLRILSISGAQAREVLNAKYFDTRFPILLSSAAVFISALALIFQIVFQVFK